MMSVYDNEGKRHQLGFRLTTHQQDKVNHICGLFHISHQRLFSDMIDYFFMEYLDIQSGRISISHAIKTSMLDLMDDYIKLKEVKGLKPAPYVRVVRG